MPSGAEPAKSFKLPLQLRLAKFDLLSTILIYFGLVGFDLIEGHSVELSAIRGLSC